MKFLTLIESDETLDKNYFLSAFAEAGSKEAADKLRRVFLKRYHPDVTKSNNNLVQTIIDTYKEYELSLLNYNYQLVLNIDGYMFKLILKLATDQKLSEVKARLKKKLEEIRFDGNAINSGAQALPAFHEALTQMYGETGYKLVHLDVQLSILKMASSLLP